MSAGPSAREGQWREALLGHRAQGRAQLGPAHSSGRRHCLWPSTWQMSARLTVTFGGAAVLPPREDLRQPGCRAWLRTQRVGGSRTGRAPNHQAKLPRASASAGTVSEPGAQRAGPALALPGCPTGLPEPERPQVCLWGEEGAGRHRHAVPPRSPQLSSVLPVVCTVTDAGSGQMSGGRVKWQCLPGMRELDGDTEEDVNHGRDCVSLLGNLGAHRHP